MEKRDRDFLVRADRVTANYERRITALAEEITEIEKALTLDDNFQACIDALKKVERYTELQEAYDAHRQRVSRLQEQHKQRQALNTMCADANKLSGTDGLNFWTKASKFFKEQEL